MAALEYVEIPLSEVGEAGEPWRQAPQEQAVEREEIARAMRRAIGMCTPVEQTVLERRFGFHGPERQTLREIAAELSLSAERVRQIEARAIRRMRSPPISYVVRPHMPEWRHERSAPARPVAAGGAQHDERPEPDGLRRSGYMAVIVDRSNDLVTKAPSMDDLRAAVVEDVGARRWPVAPGFTLTLRPGQPERDESGDKLRFVFDVVPA